MKKISLIFKDNRAADLFLEAAKINNKTRLMYAVQAARILVGKRRKNPRAALNKATL